jgi:hypothetical protein
MAFQLVPFLIQLFIVTVLSAIAHGLANNRDEEDPEQKHLTNDKSTEWIIPLLYGRCRVGGNKVYESSTSWDNRYAHFIIEIGEGPIEGIVREDGTTFTDTATPFPSTNPPLLYLDGELWTQKHTGYVYAEFFNGSATQNTCATLQTADPNWNEPKRHTAYIYLRLLYDMNKWLTVPKITLVVDGLKLYNPTTATVAYSRNFALMAYDIMTRPSRRGGMGIDNWHAAPPTDARIDIASLETARAYCAAKGWRGGIPIVEDLDGLEKLYLILDCFRGDVIHSETKYKFCFRDMNYETPTGVDITESDVVMQNGRTTLKIKPPADLYDLYNALEVNFINSDLEYQGDVLLISDAVAVAADNDLRQTSKKLLGLNTVDKVQSMAAYYLERMRWGHRASFSTRDALLALEPMDLVTLTHTMPGWDALDMRVLSMGIGADNTLTFELEEEDIDLYDDEYNPLELSWHTTTYPDPSADVPGVVNVAITEVEASTRLRSHTRLVIDFDAPSNYPWWDFAQVWMRIGTDTEWRYMTQSRGGYIYEQAEEGVIYYFKLVSVNIWGVSENFESAYTVSWLVAGQSAAVPGNVSGMMAIANGDSVSIYATPLTSDDIEGYEIRLGPAWVGGIFMSFNKAPSLRLSGVRPGTHTFWMAAKNNAGNYSAAPANATVRVFIPPGFTSAHSWAWDFTTGTFDNAERYSYGGNYVLRCTHTAGVLVGTWTSPSYDMTSIKAVRCWGDFLTVFIAGTSTWGGVAPDPTTWGDINVETKRWSQIFQPNSAAQLQAVLEYSENNVDWSEVGRFEILCAEVYARYLRVVVTITDPNQEEYLYLDDLNMAAYTGPA